MVPDNFKANTWAALIARKAFPIVVAYAEEHRPLRYKELDAELHGLHRTPLIKRLTIYGYPLGVIGFALEKQYGTTVPPINALVVNKTGVPGHGCDYFIKRYLPKVKYSRLSLNDKQATMRLVHEKIYDFLGWRKILKAFDLEMPPSVAGRTPIGKKKKFGKNFSKEPESEEHKALKEYVSLHPEVIGLPRSLAPGQTEYCMFSGDRVDVLFKSKDTSIAVEVKSRVSNADDLNRGLFQCIKYQAVIRAEQLELGQVPNARAVLVSENGLPDVLKEKAQLFGLKAFDRVRPD
jgi:hypothetical protein